MRGEATIYQLSSCNLFAGFVWLVSPVEEPNTPLILNQKTFPNVFHRFRNNSKIMATLDPSILGTFVFGLIAGICPCNSVLCLGLIGYLTSGNTNLSLTNILKLSLSFCVGTVLVLLPLGIIAGFSGNTSCFSTPRSRGPSEVFS
jgi:cytochrome c biogenesis protein CcdA